MNNDPTLGAGKNAETTPDPGKTVDVSKLVSDTVNAALAPVLESFSSLAKTVNGLAAERRRASEGEPAQKDGKAKEPKEPEVAALRDEVETAFTPTSLELLMGNSEGEVERIARG